MNRLFAIVCAVILPLSVSAGVRPGSLTCEMLTEPLGIAEKNPELSWILISDDHGAYQTAYRIRVSDSVETLEGGVGNMWDSGTVKSDETLHIQYCGKELSPFTRYFWQVQTTGNDGEISEWSEITWFETAMLDEKDWQACWIGDGTPQFVNDEDFYRDDPMPLFRKDFTSRSKLTSARLYISGLGYYEASINGRRVGDSCLDPGWTAHRDQVLYSVYDVTEYIRKGRNAIAVMLGNGWYNPLPLRLFGNYNLRDYQQTGRPVLKAEIHLAYSDGSVCIIPTDETWKTTSGPVVKNNVYLGEKYDARKEVPGWNTVGTDLTEWKNAVPEKGPTGRMTPQVQPPVKVRERIRPVALWKTHEGTYIVDMGRNFAGVASIKVQGRSGDEISIRYGENIHPDSTLNWLTTTAGHIKSMWNLKGGPGAPDDTYQEDHYILKGKGVETYTPRFTFHGFRYVELFNYPGDLSLDDIEGIRLAADLKTDGEFACSNEMFNRLHEITLRTFLSNVFSVQSDCPGREKMGYGGDMVATAESFIYNFDMGQFYRKTVGDFINDQTPSGGMREISPFTGIAVNGLGDGSGPLGWQLAFPYLQKQLYDFYGDKRIIERCYPAFVRQIAFLESKAVNGLFHWDIGDHVAIDTKADAFSASCFYYEHMRLIASFARILGRAGEAAVYERKAEGIRERILQAHLVKGTGRFANATQGAQAFALYYDLSAEEREKAFDILLKEYERHDWHVATGIFSCKMAFDVLRNSDRNDIAYRIVDQRTYPGWGYMLGSGATTLWESWEYPENGSSQNHPMFGSTEEWFYRSILGINPLKPGFKEIQIKPQPAGDLSWARGSYDSVRGKIVSDWKMTDAGMELYVEVPANTSATVYVKSGKGQPVDAPADAEFISWENGYSIFKVLSGKHSFKATRPQGNTRLLIRSDDIGSFHSSNLACVESYQKGITQSVELMACCPWFNEAVRLLNAPENLGLDVGVHLMLTSEWEGVKWSPLTDATGLVDEDGNFRPIIWSNSSRPGEAILDHDWNIEDVEKEFRAQIEKVKKHVPRVSHVSGHMGSYDWDPRIQSLILRLAEEYGLYVDGSGKNLKSLPFRNDKNWSASERIKRFISTLESLEEGTYLFVEHPSYDSEEMRAVGHKGYYDVARDRQGILDLLLSSEVRDAILRKGIALIGYDDLK